MLIGRSTNCVREGGGQRGTKGLTENRDLNDRGGEWFWEGLTVFPYKLQVKHMMSNRKGFRNFSSSQNDLSEHF